MASADPHKPPAPELPPLEPDTGRPTHSQLGDQAANTVSVVGVSLCYDYNKVWGEVDSMKERFIERMDIDLQKRLENLRAAGSAGVAQLWAELDQLWVDFTRLPSGEMTPESDHYPTTIRRCSVPPCFDRRLGLLSVGPRFPAGFVVRSVVPDLYCVATTHEVRHTAYSRQFALHSRQYAVRSTQSAVVKHYTQLAARSTQYCSAQYAVRSTQYAARSPQ